MEKLEDLLNYLIKNCYNLDCYGFNMSPKNDGYCIEKWGELFIWSYFERGQKSEINYFQDERIAVDFVKNIVLNDKFANSHLISILQLKEDIERLINVLQSRNVNFWTDDIPTLLGTSKRFFVVGCDIGKVLDLISIDGNEKKVQL